MITREQKRRIQKLILSFVFQQDIMNRNYEHLQSLSEASRITNEMLIDKLHQRELPVTALTDAVLMDIAFIVSDMILDRTDLKVLFLSIYNKRFTKSCRLAETIITRSKEDPQLGYLTYIKSAISLTDLERDYLLFLLLEEDYVLENDIIPDEIIELKTKKAERHRRSESFLNDDAVYFDNIPENAVFSSPSFDKFISRQEKALADYLNIAQTALYKTIEELSYVDFVPEDLSFATTPGEGGISHLACLAILQEHGGCSQFIHQMICDSRIRSGSFGYKPDTRMLIRQYYKARVYNTFMELNNNSVLEGEDFAFEKHNLYMDCKAENPRDDLIAILYLYQLDIHCKMFSVLQEEYYHYFSWEKLTHKGETERYRSIVRKFNEIIDNKEFELAAAKGQVSNLESQIRYLNSNDKKDSAIHEISGLQSRLQEKEREILHLKKQIQSQNEYIQTLLLQENDEVPQESVDLEVLQSKRYLFVGAALEALPQLPRTFPNSIFMTTPSADISHIQVDYVVLLIKWTSHAMFFKVQNTHILDHVPVINVNTKNFDRLLWELQLHL